MPITEKKTKKEEPRWLKTDRPDLVFENTSVGRLKKQIWEASEKEIDGILEEFGIPSPSELGKPGSYIQNTIRHDLVANRKKNDVVFIPIGSTENHGEASVSGHDTIMVTQILEGVRRYCAKKGLPVNLIWPPINYGSHPYHHVGMPGNVMLDEDVMKKTMLNVMLGLWNDGFRKQIIVNNHGHQWVLESVIQEFQKTYSLPGIYRTMDWHRAVREFFRTKDRGGSLDTDFVHADESEASVLLLLLSECFNKKYAVDTKTKGYLPDGHLDKSVDPFQRPCKWSEGQGHMAIEIVSTPEGVVGSATLGEAKKAKRAVACIMKYLVLLQDEILEVFPSGKLPPVEETTLRTSKEMEPFLKEPLSPGWRTVHALPPIK